MGTYIKGMEMPKEDEEIIIRIDSFGTVMTEYAPTMDGCKAFLVPPHGRLIDADELYKQVILERDEETYDAEQKNSLMHIERAYGLNMALGIIADSKTIIEAEEAKE